MNIQQQIATYIASQNLNVVTYTHYTCAYRNYARDVSYGMKMERIVRGR